jgi:hypothetical protein
MIETQDINQNRKNSRNKTPDIKEHQSKNRHIAEKITAMPKIPKILFITVITVLITAGSASAYVINFGMPSAIQSGELLVISGTGTLPAGFTTGMEFYTKAQVGNKKVATVPFTIQNNGLWSAEVDTTGWSAGEYTVTILKNPEYSYGSSSTLQKTFTVTKSTAADTDTESKTAPTPAETASVTGTAPENIPSTVTPGTTAATLKNPATTQIPNQASAGKTATGTPLPLWIPALALLIAVFRIKTNNRL